MTSVDAPGAPLPIHLHPSDAASDQSRPTQRVHLWDLVSKQTWMVAFCALGAAIAAAFAAGEPTGLAWWDTVLRMVTAGVFTVALSKSPSTVRVVVATVAAVFVGFSPWFVVAVLGFGLAIYATWAGSARSDSQLIAALTGALSIQALLRFPGFGFFGLPSCIAGIAIVTALIMGYRHTHRATRPVIRRLVASSCLVVVVLTLVGAIVALVVRSDAEQGISAARRGLAAARAGDTVELTAQLTEAEQRLTQADSWLSSILVEPMRLIPIVAQHHRAASVATHQGALVASEAALAAVDADVDQLRFRQGEFDLEVLARMAPRLESTANRLAAAGVAIEASRSPWLLSPLDNRLVSVMDELDGLLPEAQLSAQAAAVLPDMLGATEPRRYVMLFGSPGESRELGGFVGGFALLETDMGNLSLIQYGRAPAMLSIGTATPLDHPAGYPTEFTASDPDRYPQNLTSTPDVSVVARGVSDVFPELAGAPIDGIIYADPIAIAAMLEFTGPIFIDGVSQPLNSDTLADFLFEEQYRPYDDARDRFSALDSVLQATFDSLASNDLPGPERLGAVLGPAARQGRLQIVTFDDEENAFLRAARLQRVFTAPEGIDSFALTQTNGSSSKLDVYLKRDVKYTVTVGPGRQLQAVVEVDLHSEVPADAPTYMLGTGRGSGINRVLLALYTPHELTSLTVDGQPHQYVLQHDYGFNRYALFTVPVPANESASVRFELQGTADPTDYRLAIWHQPLVNQDRMQVEFTGPNGTAQTFSFELTENALVQPVPGG